jgi:hypothetical protein
MHNLTTIEINVVSGGDNPSAGFFRNKVAQQIYEESHRSHINITTKALDFVISTGMYIVTNIAYTAALIVLCAYLYIKDTYINYYHKKDNMLQ